jgi:hypothetical protein
MVHLLVQVVIHVYDIFVKMNLCGIEYLHGFLFILTFLVFILNNDIGQIISYQKISHIMDS